MVFGSNERRDLAFERHRRMAVSLNDSTAFCKTLQDTETSSSSPTPTDVDLYTNFLDFAPAAIREEIRARRGIHVFVYSDDDDSLHAIEALFAGTSTLPFRVYPEDRNLINGLAVEPRASMAAHLAAINHNLAVEPRALMVADLAEDALVAINNFDEQGVEVFSKDEVEEVSPADRALVAITVNGAHFGRVVNIADRALVAFNQNVAGQEVSPADGALVEIDDDETVFAQPDEEHVAEESSNNDALAEISDDDDEEPPSDEEFEAEASFINGEEEARIVEVVQIPLDDVTPAQARRNPEIMRGRRVVRWFENEATGEPEFFFAYVVAYRVHNGTTYFALFFDLDDDVEERNAQELLSDFAEYAEMQEHDVNDPDFDERFAVYQQWVESHATDNDSTVVWREDDIDDEGSQSSSESDEYDEDYVQSDEETDDDEE